VVIAALVVVQLVRTVPAQSAAPAPAPSVVVPGGAALPWPPTGQGAVAISDVGGIRTSGPQQPAPIASLAKMMTAYLVLQDHPLTAGETGPSIPISSADVATYAADLAASDSVLQVTLGESLTEQQALEALLVPSADNIAQLLAQWDSGSVAAFVAKMNTTAQGLGMTHTTYTDPSGLSASTVSTASDQVVMARTAMANPVFASIVGMGSATFPVGGTVQNYDYEVGHDGIIGIKTGSDSAAGGCWAFAAQRTIAGTAHTVYGVVLGVAATSLGLLEPALTAGVTLANAVPYSVRLITALPAGSVVGYIDAPWRTRIPITTVTAMKGLAQAGHAVTFVVHLSQPGGRTVYAGEPMGTVTTPDVVGVDSSRLMVGRSGSGPSLQWRLTRR
jgi:D-alanyl-D-alanine carboxypeptidase (penicillin-binding protein 5/6)